jgi:hypothetical protein
VTARSARLRRRYPRLTCASGSRSSRRPRAIEGTATTLGAGGLFVPTSDPLPLHAPLVVRFHLPGDDAELCFDAHVAWTRAAASGSAGMGIAFDDADARTELAQQLERGPISAKKRRDQVRAASDQRASSRPRGATALPIAHASGFARIADTSRWCISWPPRSARTRPHTGTPSTREIAAQVEHLVAHELVGPAQALRVHHLLVVEHDRVVERAAAREASVPERVDLAQEPERARRRDVALEALG